MTDAHAPRRCDLLFVCYGGGHANIVIPLVRHIREARPDLALQILALTNAGPAVRAAGLDCMGFRDLTDATDAQVQEYGASLAARMQGGNIDPAETVAYLGANYRDLVAREGSEQARLLYERMGRQSFLPVPTLRRLIRELQPRCVVATSAPRAERAAILAAAEEGCAAVCVVDLFATTESEWVSKPGFANAVCVLGEQVRQRLVDAGRAASDVHVTGNPAFDELAMPEITHEAAAIRARRGQNARPVILFASQPEPPLHPVTGAPSDTSLPERTEAAVVALAQRRTDWELVVRRHPNQSPIDDEGCIAPARASHRDEPLASLLHQVDCVVTFSSTVGLQGLLLGKPLIALQSSVTSAQVPYRHLDGCIPIQDAGQLEDAIDKALRLGSVSTPALPPAGGAARRVADVILPLCAGPR